VRILSVVHSAHAKTELFRPAGHELEEWEFGVRGTPPDAYDAYMVFGGSMHADQDDAHPWLAPEVQWLGGLIDRGVPVLGVCLGAQLLSRAAGGRVWRIESGPEIGWYDVELTVEGAADPVLGADVLPPRFEAFEWHHYTYEVPAGTVELARSERCTQAFRLGDACWAVQFHPEVSHAQVLGWIDDKDDPPADEAELRAETAEKIGRWNELGLSLCDAFVAAAEQTLARAA
jgi:GMP synthase (glutamine-hydrolysing)